MKQEFIINGKRLAVNVFSVKASTKLAEIPTVGGEWMERSSTGQNRVHIIGTLEDGRQVDQTYVMIGREDDGTRVLVSENYPLPIG